MAFIYDGWNMKPMNSSIYNHLHYTSMNMDHKMYLLRSFLVGRIGYGGRKFASATDEVSNDGSCVQVSHSATVSYEES